MPGYEVGGLMWPLACMFQFCILTVSLVVAVQPGVLGLQLVEHGGSCLRWLR